MPQITERQYDLINNEGSEGYNPIRARREQAEFDAAHAAPVCLGDLEHRLDILTNTTDPATIAERADRVAALKAQIAAMRAAQQAEFAAAWPVTLTTERRATWNAWVRASGGITPVERAAHERKIGWTMADLRRAIALHSL
jgi:hypothetical protein